MVPPPTRAGRRRPTNGPSASAKPASVAPLGNLVSKVFHGRLGRANELPESVEKKLDFRLSEVRMLYLLLGG